MVMLVPSVVIGTGVTVAALYAMQEGFNDILGTIVIVVALLISGVLGVVGMGLSSELPGMGRGEDETIRTLRASHRALLEEMDEMIDLLTDIRNTLSHAGEEEE